jgi:hypothetical protein
MPVGRAGRIVVGLLAAIALVLVLAQVFLPAIAANRVRARIGKYGTVESVIVKAWPAVELLWGKADSVKVTAESLRVSSAQAAKLLWEGRGVGMMSMAVASVKEGPLRLHDASFEKHGDALKGQAWAAPADVKAALGEGYEVRILNSSGGQVEVSVGGGLFGLKASVDAVARAQDGKLVVRPLGLLLGGLQLTLFADPHVRVEGVGASAVAGAGGVAGYRLTMRASLH